MQTATIDEGKTQPQGPIVFYDGECGFCARSVAWVLKRDPKGVFKFAPLQGETARKVVGAPAGTPDTWSMILVDEDGTFDRSTAALRILRRLGRGRFLAALGLAVPRAIRDFAYRMIAKIRYRMWGKVDSCSLPTKEQRGRFLP